MASQDMLRHSEYTVAWICTFGVECAAAQAMLDEVHEPLPGELFNGSTLFFGTAANHHVVIVYLDATIPRASDATKLPGAIRILFPGIKLILNVGIGSGIKTSVKLGDVVSTLTSPRNMTKAEQSEHTVQLSRSITTAPLVLRGAIDAVCDTWQSFSNIPKMCQLLPEEDHDWPLEFDGENWTLEDNEDLNKFQTLYSQPSVHRGLSAFASHGMEKTELRSFLDEQAVSCVQHDSIELTDLPFLLVRGIANHVDSPVSRHWQVYAALMAAAYTKAFLVQIPVYQAAYTSRMVNYRPRHLVMPRTEVSKVFNHTSRQIRDLFLWDQETKRIAISGPPGAGKTALASAVASKFEQTRPEFSVFWVDSSTRDGMSRSLLKIAQCLGIEATTASRARSMVYSYLCDGQSGKWLLILAD